MSEYHIDSIEKFITQIRNDCRRWQTDTYPWFRGEPESDTPLLPKLYREKPDGTYHNENQLVQFFRMKAPALIREPFPPIREHTDEWLFLMQQVGLPTRLLDWTEGALIALYFALLEKKPIVWMLNPLELNRLSVTDGVIQDNVYPLTWVQSQGKMINIGSVNIQGAWTLDQEGVDLPVAIHPTNIHPRMSAQKSCFTVHGKKKECLSNLISPDILKRYVIDPAQSQSMIDELKMLGISHTTIFPEPEGLSKELGISF